MNFIKNILTYFFCWEIVDENNKKIIHLENAVYALYPHTSAWDLMLSFTVIKYNMFVIVKKNLNWLQYMGLPVFGINRENQNQTKIIQKQLKNKSVAIWISGTRKKNQYIRSGFYWIALKAEIPIYFVGVDWRTKTLHLSDKIDPSKTSKDEILIYLKKWSEKLDLQNAGLYSENASTLAWREN